MLQKVSPAPDLRRLGRLPGDMGALAAVGELDLGALAAMGGEYLQHGA